MKNIITFRPFKIYKPGDNNVIIPTSQVYEERKQYLAGQDYPRYAMVLPRKHFSKTIESIRTLEEDFEERIGYETVLANCAKDLVDKIAPFPELKTKEGLALDFNVPFQSLLLPGKDRPDVYITERFIPPEIAAFMDGLSERKNELKYLAEVPVAHYRKGIE